MPLNKTQVNELENAIKSYGFPPQYWDFTRGCAAKAPSMKFLEQLIYKQLTAGKTHDVKRGLANVVFWGNAGAGYQMDRFDKFITKITPGQINSFIKLIAGGNIPTLKQIASLKMPGYSKISFVSKLLMFLNPRSHCVLDLQLRQLRTNGGPGPINRVKFYSTSIPITKHNSVCYDDWRQQCHDISDKYYKSKYRTVDVERGFFNLIQTGNNKLAQNIYSAA